MWLQVTSCAHTFCRSCLVDFTSSVAQVSCPSCSKPLTVDLNSSGNRVSNTKTTIKGFRASSILNRILLDEFQTSTKIDALVCYSLPLYFYFPSLFLAIFYVFPSPFSSGIFFSLCIISSSIYNAWWLCLILIYSVINKQTVIVTWGLHAYLVFSLKVGDT